MDHTNSLPFSPSMQFFSNTHSSPLHNNYQQYDFAGNNPGHGQFMSTGSSAALSSFTPSQALSPCRSMNSISNMNTSGDNATYMHLKQHILALEKENIALTTELSSTKSMLSKVLERLPLTNSEATGNSLHSTKQLVAPLNQANYPNIKFWTQKAYKKARQHTIGDTNALATQKRKRGRPRQNIGEDSDQEDNIEGRHTYIEDINGNPANRDLLWRISLKARQCWFSMRKLKMAPDSWRVIDADANEFFKREMQHDFVEFCLCEGNWKLDHWATLNYPSWVQNHLKGKDPEDPKVRLSKKIKTDPTTIPVTATSASLDDKGLIRMDEDSGAKPNQADLPTNNKQCEDNIQREDNIPHKDDNRHDKPTPSPIPAPGATRIVNPLDNLDALIDDITNTRKPLTSTNMDDAPMDTGKVIMPANATSTSIISSMDDTPVSDPTRKVNVPVNATSTCIINGLDDASVSDATGEVNVPVNPTSIGMEDTLASYAATCEGTTPAPKDPSQHIAEPTTSTSQGGKKTGAKAEKPFPKSAYAVPGAADTPMNLCMRAWLETHPGGLKADFKEYYKTLAKEELRHYTSLAKALKGKKTRSES